MCLGVGVLAAAVTLTACRGENLFDVPGTFGTGGPEVTITAPGEGSTLAPGASVRIRADVVAPGGLTTAAYSGLFTADRSAAFVAETEDFQSLTIAALDNTLVATGGGGVGEVWIVVRVTDTQGQSKADTVTITIS